MPPLSNAQVADLAKRLGHTKVAIGPTASGRRWIVECACGYGAAQSNGKPSITRATFDEAVRTGQHHLRSSVQRFLAERARNGAPSPLRGSRSAERGASSHAVAG